MRSRGRARGCSRGADCAETKWRSDSSPSSSCAGLYADHVAHTGPNENHLGETFTRDGEQVPVVSVGGFVNGEFKAGGIPVGPQLWHAGGKYVFGADTQGRDVAVRQLYGGRNSLKVGIGASIICCAFALIFALLAGYYAGKTDWIISRFFDLIWAFPVLLLAIALGTALSINGFHHFGINIEGGSLWIPTLVIAFVLIPYVGRPLRGQILSLREKEFIEARRCSSSSPSSSRATSSPKRASRSSGRVCSRRTRRGGRSSPTARTGSSRLPGSRSSRGSRSS